MEEETVPVAVPRPSRKSRQRGARVGLESRRKMSTRRSRIRCTRPHHMHVHNVRSVTHTPTPQSACTFNMYTPSLALTQRVRVRSRSICENGVWRLPDLPVEKSSSSKDLEMSSWWSWQTRELSRHMILRKPSGKSIFSSFSPEKQRCWFWIDAPTTLVNQQRSAEKSSRGPWVAAVACAALQCRSFLSKNRRCLFLWWKLASQLSCHK